MKKRIISLVMCFLCISSISFAGLQQKVLIDGIVNHPLTLTIEDLSSFQSVQVQLNEVRKDGKYSGVFYYRGVPLKTLLQVAFIKKMNTDFSKPVDLAVVVRNRKGQEIAIAWGEIFYHNPAEIILATSAIPIVPHHDCKTCHSPEVYKSRLNQLHRRIEFPKLVITSDNFSDRCLEGIVSVRVIDLRPKVKTKKQDILFSPGFTVTGTSETPFKVNDSGSFPRRSAKVKMIGEGKGYHGVVNYEGILFKSVLHQAGVGYDLKSVFLVSAPDGYRSLFSYGEVFLSPYGDRIIIADKMHGRPLKKGGKFFLIHPGDLMADRDVKSVQNIQVIHLP